MSIPNPVGMPGAQILTGNRRGSAHQADRRPRDERKELRVGDGVRRLRLGAVFERADEPQQHHAGDVHRHAL